MKVAILGAAGRTGQELVQQALVAGHEVTAFIREGEAFAPQPKLAIVTGDARSADDLSRAFAGQDAVISGLGSNKPKDDLMVRAIQAVITAAKQQGVRRFMLLSSFLAAPVQRKGIVKLLAPLMRGMLNDKSDSEQLLMQSDLDWTIVYATALDRAPKGSPVRIVDASETLGAANGIARADVAAFMLKALAENQFVKQSVIITAR